MGSMHIEGSTRQCGGGVNSASLTFGQKTCRKCFLAIHNIGQFTLHSTMKHYCNGEEDTLRLLKAGIISVVEVAEAEKPRLLQPMNISADCFHYLNKEIKHYLHSDSRIPWENEEYHASYLDTIYWPFLLILWQNPCFCCKYLYSSLLTCLCALSCLNQCSNFALVFST